MATLARLRAKAADVVSEFFARSSLAEEHRDREVKAVITIQSYARGFLIRRRTDRLRDVAMTIQRFWRGYLGRLRAKLAKEERDKRLRQAFFDAMATVISRHWRGFWSRKHLFDFYARARFLQQVKQKNADIREELGLEAARAKERQQEMAEAHARKLFDERLSNLHHLMSTSHQPGIFNSPYSLAANTVPVVMGMTLEEHLKATFKAQAPLRLPPIKKGTKKGPPGSKASLFPSPEVTVDGRKMPPHISLQQSIPYSQLHQAELLEEKVQRAEMLNVHPVPFAGTQARPFYPPINPQSNRNVEHYITPFDPTVGRRTETFSPDMKKVSEKLFLKYQHKQPFFDPQLHKEGY